MSDDILDYIRLQIQSDREGFAEELARGFPQDYAAYMHVVGKIAALDTVITAIKDIKEKLEKE